MKLKDYIDKLLRLEIHLTADLAGLLTLPRNESLSKVLNLESAKKLLQEQSIASWENYIKHIPAYERSLQAITNAEVDFSDDPNYLHNNMDKLLTCASDLRQFYDETLKYLNRKVDDAEVASTLALTKLLVNGLLGEVRKLVDLDQKFKVMLQSKGIDYIAKYKLSDVD